MIWFPGCGVNPLDCLPMTDEEERKLNSYDRWIRANDVTDLEFEEVTNKPNDNDKRTSMADSLPANSYRGSQKLIEYPRGG